MATAEKLTPLDELINVKNEFISLRDVIRTIECIYDMRHEDIAEWLIMRLCIRNKILTVESKGIAGAFEKFSEDKDNVILIQMLGDVIIYGEDVMEPYFKLMGYDANDVTPYEEFRYVGFIREELEKITGIKFDIGFFCDNEDYDEEDLFASSDELYQATEVKESIAKWEETYGIETALMLYAGAAITLAKNDPKYRRGGKLNKSQVIRSVESSLAAYGGAFGVGNKQLSNLTEKALTLAAPKLTDDVTDSSTMTTPSPAHTPQGTEDR
ncbi:hypothetical protein S518_004259 [Salmonella enterica subsp. enterica]|nr:hypothetical protein [Salmonella enterica subsp. enterica]